MMAEQRVSGKSQRRQRVRENHDQLRKLHADYWVEMFDGSETPMAYSLWLHSDERRAHEESLRVC